MTECVTSTLTFSGNSTAASKKSANKKANWGSGNSTKPSSRTISGWATTKPTNWSRRSSNHSKKWTTTSIPSRTATSLPDPAPARRTRWSSARRRSPSPCGGVTEKSFPRTSRRRSYPRRRRTSTGRDWRTSGLLGSGTRNRWGRSWTRR